MSEPAAVTQEVERVIEAADRGLQVNDLTAIAADYADRVSTLNKRVARCVSLLRKGLISEAVHLAELPPAVLDEAVSLTLNRPDEWRELCLSEGLDPVLIDETGVIEIDEAFAHHAGLADLLRKHRLMTLGRQPLHRRIPILRRLTQVDSENFVWGEDLEAAERARHKEIANEARRAASQGDKAGLRRLMQECEQVWLVSPPAEIKELVSSCLAQELHRRAAESLPQLRESLSRALDHGDRAGVSLALQQWAKCRSRLQTPLDPGDAALIERAERWVVDADEREAADAAWTSALLALEVSLDDRRPFEEVEQRWNEVLKHERSVPQVLKTRFLSRSDEAKLGSSRRFRLVMLGSLAAVVVCGAGVAVAITWLNEARTLDRWVTQVESAIAADEWPEGQRLLNRLEEQDPEMWSQPAIQRLATTVAEGGEADRRRREIFEQAVAAVRQRDDDGLDLAALEEARAHAVSAEEKRIVAQIDAEIAADEAERQQQADARFVELISDVRARYAAWQKNNDAGSAGIQALRDIESDLSDAMLQSGASANLIASAEPLVLSVRQILGDYQETRSQEQKLEAALRRIEVNATSATGLVDALEQFTSEMPGHRYADDFERVLSLSNSLHELTRWSSVARGMERVLVNDPDEAERRIKMIDTFLGSAPNGAPVLGRLADYRAYLQTAITALRPGAGNRSQIAQLTALAKGPAVSDLWYLDMVDGQRLYLKSPRVRAPFANHLDLPTVTSLEQVVGSEPTRRKLLPANKVLPRFFPQGSETPVPEITPQSLLGRKLRSLVKDPSVPWEVRPFEAYRMVLEAEDVDPILRGTLADFLAEMAVTSGWPKIEDASRVASSFGDLHLDVAWMDPEDRDADRSRSRVAAILDDAPRFESIRATLDAWVEETSSALSPKRLVGVVWQDDKGVRVVAPTPNKEYHRNLSVLQRNGNQLELDSLDIDRDSDQPAPSLLAGYPMAMPIFAAEDDQWERAE